MAKPLVLAGSSNIAQLLLPYNLQCPGCMCVHSVSVKGPPVIFPEVGSACGAAACWTRRRSRQRRSSASTTCAMHALHSPSTCLAARPLPCRRRAAQRRASAAILTSTFSGTMCALPDHIPLQAHPYPKASSQPLLLCCCITVSCPAGACDPRVPASLLQKDQMDLRTDTCAGATAMVTARLTCWVHGGSPSAVTWTECMHVCACVRVCATRVPVVTSPCTCLPPFKCVRQWCASTTDI